MKRLEKLLPSGVFPGDKNEAKARALYGAIVAQARQPHFYSAGKVPDSVDGRFDLMVLHLFLVLRRLKGQGDEARAFSQTLFDLFVFDLDQSIRESGVGYLKAGPRLKEMGQAFYGRVEVYEKAMSEGSEALRSCLARNLYAGALEKDAQELVELEAYVLRQEAHLSALALEEVLKGQISFAGTEG